MGPLPGRSVLFSAAHLQAHLGPRHPDGLCHSQGLRHRPAPNTVALLGLTGEARWGVMGHGSQHASTRCMCTHGGSGKDVLLSAGGPQHLPVPVGEQHSPAPSLPSGKARHQLGAMHPGCGVSRVQGACGLLCGQHGDTSMSRFLTAAAWRQPTATVRTQDVLDGT